MSSPSAQLGPAGYGVSGLHVPATVVQAPCPSSPMSQADTILAAEGADRSLSVAAAARSLPRRLWQPDLEAEQCSLLTCGAKFAWPKERRHHCRQCGRVVCAACSNRTKILLPPKGERGGPSNMRVCEACFLSHETFTMLRTGGSFQHHRCGSSSSSNSVDASSMQAMSPSAPRRRFGQLRPSTSSPAIMQALLVAKVETPGGQVASPCILKRQQSVTDQVTDQLTAMVSAAAETSNPGSPSSDTKSSSKGTSSPVRVPRGHALPGDDVQDPGDQVHAAYEAAEDMDAAEQLLGDVAPANVRRREWIQDVQKRFGTDPHYHAMLKYEPQALKALITCTMTPSAAN